MKVKLSLFWLIKRTRFDLFQMRSAVSHDNSLRMIFIRLIWMKALNLVIQSQDKRPSLFEISDQNVKLPNLVNLNQHKR